MNTYEPLTPYEFTYRQLLYTGRNYEYMLPIHLLKFEKDLRKSNLWNEFTDIYTTHENPPELHNQFDELRKKKIDNIVRNGQILNLYLIKKRFLTLEYLRLIAWGYSPLPPHYITPTLGDQHDT